MSFAENLKACRKASPYKQREVAELIGISLRTYQGYEEGRSEPNIAKLIALARLFDISLDDLTGRSDLK